MPWPQDRSCCRREYTSPLHPINSKPERCFRDSTCSSRSCKRAFPGPYSPHTHCLVRFFARRVFLSKHGVFVVAMVLGSHALSVGRPYQVIVVLAVSKERLSHGAELNLLGVAQMLFFAVEIGEPHDPACCHQDSPLNFGRLLNRYSDFVTPRMSSTDIIATSQRHSSACKRRSRPQ